MRRIMVLAMTLLLAFSLLSITVAAGNDGPAPNSGDSVSDGSGFDFPSPANSDGAGDAFGPAPNSGDGIPDGSGMTQPNGPAI
jgi:hypothetical protein